LFLLPFIGGAKVVAELGGGYSNTYDFVSKRWLGGQIGVYFRAYSEWKLPGAELERKEFRFSYGGELDIF
jgi:hypothetical protein